MKLNNLRPVIYVPEIKTTLDYYREHFGFETRCNETASWGYAFKDAVEIMFSIPNAHLPFTATAFTGSLYINTDDVNAWWALVKEKCTIVYPVETFSYGMREFAVRDLNGIILQFG